MLTINDYPYFQPDRYYDDGTNIEYLGMPEELFSFQAFRTEVECRQWLINHDYNPDDFYIHKYRNDDIEGVVIINADGDVIMKIEDVPTDGIVHMLANEVLMNADYICDNLRATRQSDETEKQFKDRVYAKASDEVNAAICRIEERNEFDFSSYGGNPDVEWYDEARDDAVRIVIGFMTEQPKRTHNNMKRENFITENLAVGLLDTNKPLVFGVLNTAVMGYAFIAGNTPECLENLGCFDEDIEKADKMKVGEVIIAECPVENAVLIVKMKDDRTVQE